jgi:hypothetical protein
MLFPIYFIHADKISDVASRYVFSIDVRAGVLCVEKITTVVTFLSNCWQIEVCKSGFVFAAASETKFEMSSKMKTETAQNCMSGKGIKANLTC